MHIHTMRQKETHTQTHTRMHARMHTHASIRFITHTLSLHTYSDPREPGKYAVALDRTKRSDALLFMPQLQTRKK